MREALNRRQSSRSGGNCCPPRHRPRRIWSRNASATRLYAVDSAIVSRLTLPARIGYNNITMRVQLQAGAAAVDVSPTKSMFLYGYPHVKRYSSGVHDPLLASALFLSDGGHNVL